MPCLMKKWIKILMLKFFRRGATFIQGVRLFQSLEYAIHIDKNVFSDCLFQNYVLMKSSLQNNLLWNFGVNLVLCEATP